MSKVCLGSYRVIPRRRSARLLHPDQQTCFDTDLLSRIVPGTDIVWLADASAAHDHGSRNQAQSAERDWAIG